ncbi:MAG: putative ATP-dependent RNA helicase DHR1 [Peltula sp. TS41687]|nr:MAG: putative ATP-dependent RNA helicase DHR1 [Peltula sp. TS41687]
MPKFVPRQRKQKKARENGKPSKLQAQDSNITEMIPSSTTEREERRRRLREELRSQQPKISAKKQKRLDKYIENKLRKNENLELLKKLAQAKVDTSHLRSSKNLGTKKDSRAEVALQGKGDVTSEGRVQLDSDLDDDKSTDDEEGAGRGGAHPTAAANDESREISKQNVVLGSGLKRPLELDSDGKPVVVKKKRKIGALPTLLLTAKSTGFLCPLVNSPNAFQSSDEGSGTEDTSKDSDNGRENDDDDDSTSTSSSHEHTEGNDKEKLNQRVSAFKAWADQRRNEAAGFQPTVATQSDVTTSPTKPPFSSIQHRKKDEDPLPVELEIKDSDRKAFSVPVERDLDISTRRLALPVVAEEQKIMEAIHNNPVVVICGATGSGKTTQVPQFLFESGYGNPNSENPGMVGITQPRRVAAVSMAKRVATELGKDGDRVAYKIRFEGTVKEKTVIKFMTDGILLREASTDIALRKYSAIIIDEAHERSIDTDILIGMMSRIVKLRENLHSEDINIKPLKLIIMSATLTVADFTGNKNLFSPPPLVNVEGRQYPVTIHWARRTNRDYLEEAYKKICKGHRMLPPGGILVFLTGKNEIVHLLRRLKQEFPPKTSGQVSSGLSVQVMGSEAPLEVEDLEIGPLQGQADDSGSDTDGSIGESINVGEDEDEFRIDDSVKQDMPMHVLPLYSLLPTSEQLRVFDPPPDGSRLVVLATNIAETSLTIPGIRYVFDCGRAKERKYNEDTGVQSFEVGWISKASANQRAGRAGRTGPGHCYRLYSSAVYERDLEERTQPEIQRTPLEGVVLQLVGLGVPNILHKFPFPSPPDPERLVKAKNLLSYLGALTKSEQLTELGRKMSALPLLPRFSKMLLTGYGHGCLPYTIALVAALSVPDLFLPENYLDTSEDLPGADDKIFDNALRLEEDAREARMKAYHRIQGEFSQLGGKSDVMKLLSAVLDHAEAHDPGSFCAEKFLRAKAMRETQMLRQQLSHLLSADPVYSSMISSNQGGALPRPSAKQIKCLKQIAASGFVDQVAIRADLAPQPPEQLRKSKRAINVPYLPLFPSTTHRGEDQSVYIHPSSVLARSSAADLPEYIIYSSLQRSANSSKVRMLPLTPVGSKQLAALTRGTQLQSYGKPIKDVQTDTPDGLRRESWVIPTLRGRAGTQGWPLPAQRIILKKVNGTWVEC